MTDIREPATQKRSPWREPMVWLVIAIPAAAVLVSFILLYASEKSSGNNDMVPDKVQRTAQIQTVDMSPDQAAAKLGLAALLRIDGEAVEIVPLHAGFDTARPLQLILQHPARQDLDRALVLKPSAAGWRVEAAKLDRVHDWNLQLTQQGGNWRLKGRLPRGQLATRLQPETSG